MTLTKQKIRFFVEFIFDSRGMIYPSISARHAEDEVPLELSSLAIFIHRHKGDLSDSDTDFCYSLGKFLKKMSFNGRIIMAIPNESDVVKFFRRAMDRGIELYWKNQGEMTQIHTNGTLPYTIEINKIGHAMHCNLAKDMYTMHSSIEWVSFYQDKNSVIFSNGNLFFNLPEKLIDFINDLFEKTEVIYKDTDIAYFINTIYLPFQKMLKWDSKTDLSQYIPQHSPPRGYLELSYQNKTLIPTLLFKYGSEIVSPNDKDGVIKDPVSGKRYARQPEAENKLQAQLMERFLEYQLPFMLQSPGDIAKFMGDLIPALKKQGWSVKSNVPEFHVHDDPIDLQFNISSHQDHTGQNWFDFEPNVSIHGNAMSLQELARLMVENQGYIKTKSGYVKLTEDSQKELKFLSDMGALRIGKKFSKADMLPIVSMIQANGKSQASEDLIKNTQFASIDFCQLGPEFKGSLRDYQQYGVNWMQFLYKSNFGGILADDMGLGKTIQSIAFTTLINKENTSLIIGPTNVIYNWQRELKQFYPKAKVVVYTGSNREKALKDCPNPDFIITTYGIVKNDFDKLSKINFEALFIDEAQAIKNPKAQVSDAVKGLNAKFRLILTGTPIENHFQDLWNLFDVVMPGYLGNHTVFDNAIKNGGKDILKAKMRPFVLRREKREVLNELPEKTEIILKCEMSEAQERLYQTVLDAARRGVRDSQGRTQKLAMFAALLKLRQVCLHPGLLQETNTIDIPSTKFEMMTEKVAELIDEDHKIVLFSQFTKMLDIIEKWAKAEGIPTERIDGSVPAKKRMDIVNNFQKTEKATLMLISLKAGGMGINLTSADYVIHMDPWWNPAIESQATDRVHRMGQQNKVIVYKLITEGSIEEKIQTLQQNKREMLSEMIDIDSIEDKKIDVDELKELLFQ